MKKSYQEEMHAPVIVTIAVSWQALIRTCPCEFHFCFTQLTANIVTWSQILYGSTRLLLTLIDVSPDFSLNITEIALQALVCNA